jgi:EAL domain-containing protein (putative c-di-GMP-specific phosphodiesterase class I)
VFDIDQFAISVHGIAPSEADRILVQLAKELGELAEQHTGAQVARVGPDEFSLYCPGGPDVEDFHARVQSFSRSRRYARSDCDDHIEVSLSLGWSEARTPYQSSESLLAEAELALRDVKRLGRGKCAPYRVEVVQQALRNHRLENELSRAIGNDELHLYFQPIVEAETLQVRGFEALLRWQREGRNVAMPDVFIPIAESTGLIVPIGEWVTESAVESLKRVRAECGRDDLYVSINVSNIQLDDSDYPERVSQIVKCHECQTSSVVIEVTESCITNNIEANLASLQLLRYLGFSISIDDFGSGFSSLNKLATMPFDVVKLDQAFLARIVGDANSWNTVVGVIRLIASLHKTIVAEGVETTEQLRLLQSVGCDLVQGHLVSKPLPEDRLIDFIKASRAEESDHRAAA